ncbi:hypothetical protein FSP39_024351 [Pinctada imbricata]|uniref:Negative elongation factor B n=1 Tax=Pinctada imbricata TaxID=66713 RepID=A0AA88XNS5_PINIB|nr:hypothetical protein FSP39_024351 [Pinctada imbricata]
MSGLEELGIPGGEALRESLTNCADPLASIEEFQAENSILLPSLKPALHFLDLHEIKRLDFHNSVLEELREKLIQQISDVANREDDDRFTVLESLLEKSFPVIKIRRQSEVVQQLANMVGKNIKLYDMVLQFLRTLFLRTRNTHYCTLRAELLMTLHDQEVNDICSIDPCHKFTWCVDACIRDKFIDAKRSRELQGFLDGIKRGQEFVLGDLSMILCDPFALNTVALSMMKNLQHCINTDGLPRESAEILLLVRMLSLGLGSWDMIDSQLFREPKLESALFTKFLPMITSMMIDDQVRTLNVKMEDPRQPVQPPSDLFLAFIKENAIASMIALYYTLQVTRQKDRVAACNIVPVLVHCENERSYDDTFLHSFISYLIAMAEEFCSEDFCVAVFDDFILPAISRENVLRHLLRLLWYIHPKLPTGRLQALLDSTQPNNEHSEAVHSTYLQLMDKVNTYEPSPLAPQEQLDSPLMSVPTPAPIH